MKRWTSRRLAQRLEPGQKPPEPPPGLLEKLKEDVPAQVSLHPRLAGRDEKETSPRSFLAVAASLTVLVGGGLLAFWLTRQPLAPPLLDAPSATKEALDLEQEEEPVLMVSDRMGESKEELAGTLKVLDEAMVAEVEAVGESDKDDVGVAEGMVAIAAAPVTAPRNPSETDMEPAASFSASGNMAQGKQEPQRERRMSSGEKEKVQALKAAPEASVAQRRHKKGRQDSVSSENGSESRSRAGLETMSAADGEVSTLLFRENAQESTPGSTQTVQLTATPCPGETGGSCVLVLVDAPEEAPRIEPELSQVHSLREVGSASQQQRLYRLELTPEIDSRTPLARLEGIETSSGAEPTLYPSDVVESWPQTPARVRLAILQALQQAQESPELVLQEARLLARELPHVPEAQALAQQAERDLKRP